MRLNIRNKILVSVLPILIISLVLSGYVSYRVASNTIVESEKNKMAETVSSINRQLDNWYATLLASANVLSRDRDLIEACETGNWNLATPRLQDFF